MKQSLNGIWRLYGADDKLKYDLKAKVPGSLYYTLMKYGLMKDPYYRENEYKATDISRGDCVYERRFPLTEEMLSAETLLLKFHGIDTIADIFLNGELLGRAENMHREYVFDITGKANETDNLLEVKIYSPIKYIEEKNAETPLWGVASTMAGYPHIRKAHYMFGWDWGPKLPDMGIWRDVELIAVNGGLIDGVYVRQDHSKVSEGTVGLDIDITAGYTSDRELEAEVKITAPDGSAVTEKAVIDGRRTSVHIDISDPKLWYPRGYGEQPLYKLSVTLLDGENTADKYECEIGLRTVTVSTAPDEYGEEFAFVVNGLKIFAMGANYIPENQIIPKCSPSKTERLLKQCCLANFNMIRVWGGGYYPDDSFYSACDRMGLLVWQDFMFACSVYKADRDFCENVMNEVADNVKRIRNHPSLALWCGNNEIESMWQYWGIDADPKYKSDYLRLFEALIPKVLRHYDPVTYYHPSSPSSGGSFDESSAENRGDSHYWDVWHGLKPFTDYYKYNFRFCSEYGFESLPSIKTIRTFAEEDDLNLCSPVMEAHQKCEAGTEKIMYYLAQMSRYPYDFKGLIYATQMVQSDAVRLNAEHMRRHRGRSMGCLYWQVNDSNPVISWSSIDCYHRWKALHYRARHFFAPVLISADCENLDEINLYVSSERQQAFEGKIHWCSRKNTGEIICEGSEDITISPLSAEKFVTLTPENTKVTKDMRSTSYIEFSLAENGSIISENTCLYVQPKAFRFADPALSYDVEDAGKRFKITINAKAFAKGVCLDLTEGDCLFSDNWFDMHSGSVTVYASKANLPEKITAKKFKENLGIVSYYEALHLSGKE